MAHFAKVRQGKVVKVIVAEPEFFDTFVDDEAGTWLMTSYNTRGGIHYGPDGLPDGGEPLRMNYAGVGCTYDAIKDAFIPPQPFPSWTLDESTCLWKPPVEEPEGGNYLWDEATLTWVEDVQ
jgi:hypothetical protein